MATNVKFLRGAEASLPSTGTEGYFYLTTDTHKLHVGLAGGAIVCLNQEVVWVDLRSELPNVGSAKKLYYVKDENILCYWDGSKYQQANPDTGATSVEIVGSGNAITNAEYDAKTRKIILTKGETFATKSELDDLADTVEAAKAVVYEVSITKEKTLDEILAENTNIVGKAGDILVVSKVIATKTEGDETITIDSKSSYYYDKNDGWVAIDGNVDASRVILTSDIKLAGDYTQVGNLSKEKTGTKDFAVKGKSVQAALVEMLSKRLQPTKTNPSFTSLKFTNSILSYEVGSAVAPTYELKIDDGSYTYNSTTGSQITYTLKDSTGATLKDSVTVSGNTQTVTGSGTSIANITDGQTITLTATGTYSDGNVAKDNLDDNSSPVVQVTAGTMSSKSGSNSITSYRAWFAGGDSKTTLTSADIRALTNKGAPSSNTFEFKAADYSGCKRFIVAIPVASGKSVKEVYLKSSSNADILGEFKKQDTTVEVAGANSYATTKPYNVWVYQPASLDSTEVYTIVIG